MVAKNLLQTIAAAVLPALLSSPLGATVTAVFVGETDSDVRATAITDTEYEMGGTHTAYATAKIVSPTGRTAQSTDVQENEAIAEVTLPINQEAGIYTAYNWQPQEYCPALQRLVDDPQADKDLNLTLFVKLFDTSLSKSSISVRNDSTDFTVHVRTSNGCQGNVTVDAGMIKKPIEIDAKIWPRDPDRPEHNSSATKTLFMPEKAQADFRFGVRTTNTNATTGSIDVDSELLGVPPGCQKKGPDAGRSKSRKVTVTQ